MQKFDASFFGMHAKQSNTTDPQGRHLLECAYEAIVDAGIHPESLRNTRTGVYISSSFSEAEKSFVYDQLSENGLALPG